MSTLNNKKGHVLSKSKGFTLIEIVIVLAIAALILAGILVAVQGAQKNRRDTQRKTDTGQIMALMEQSASNFLGRYPGDPGPPAGDSLANFNTKYLAANSTNMRDPLSGALYNVGAGGAWGTCTYVGPAGSMRYMRNPANGRQIQLCMDLESTDSARFSN